MDLEKLWKKPRQTFTLVYPLGKDGRVLLGYKKRGFRSGKWNGFGGRAEPGENVADAAVRELEEQCGLRTETSHLDLVGINYFEYTNNHILLEAYIYTCHEFEGEIRETEEIVPKWYPIGALPATSDLCVDQEIWLQLLLKEQSPKFLGYFLLRDYFTIVKYILVKMDEPHETIVRSKNFEGL